MFNPVHCCSFDGRPVIFEMATPSLVLIDPLALDGLSSELQSIDVQARDPIAAIAPYSGYLRIGVHTILNFRPGLYRLALTDFIHSESGDDPRDFDIDSGNVVAIDFTSLGAVARHLDWDTFDSLLRSPVDDESVCREIVHAVGGPCFAIVSAHSATPFDGDGCFRLNDSAPVPA